MTQPAYRLRPNKAVDRLIFVEAIQRFADLKDLRGYTYFGFGGAFLEDFRVLSDFFSGFSFVSIEESEEVVKRQQFHLPCRNIRLQHASFQTFLDSYAPQGDQGIFWLDYTKLELSQFSEFELLLQKVELWSMVKITLRAQPRGFGSFGNFRSIFARVLPAGTSRLPTRPLDFASLISRMLRIAAQRGLVGYSDRVFQPISSFFYNDSTPMMTLTGVVCPSDCLGLVRNAYENWEFRNLDWNPPTHISVPVLSTKERLALQTVLPCDDSAGILMQMALGYKLGGGGRHDDTQQQLRQYARFHKYYPYYVAAVP